MDSRPRRLTRTASDSPSAPYDSATNGNVVVPIEDFNGASIISFMSTDGGNTWGAPVTVSTITDHLVGMGTVGRCLALAVLVGFSLWYLAMHVGPLLIRTINPAYAARTIEEATPTLKNSLINFLLLRHFGASRGTRICR